MAALWRMAGVLFPAIFVVAGISIHSEYVAAIGELDPMYTKVVYHDQRMHCLYNAYVGIPYSFGK